MNARVFDIAMVVGTLLGSVGAGLQWGLPCGLMTAGALVIGITMAEAFLLN